MWTLLHNVICNPATRYWQQFGRAPGGVRRQLAVSLVVTPADIPTNNAQRRHPPPSASPPLPPLPLLPEAMPPLPLLSPLLSFPPLALLPLPSPPSPPRPPTALFPVKHGLTQHSAEEKRSVFCCAMQLKCIDSHQLLCMKLSSHKSEAAKGAGIHCNMLVKATAARQQHADTIKKEPRAVMETSRQTID